MNFKLEKTNSYNKIRTIIKQNIINENSENNIKNTESQNKIRSLIKQVSIKKYKNDNYINRTFAKKYLNNVIEMEKEKNNNLIEEKQLNLQ